MGRGQLRQPGPRRQRERVLAQDRRGSARQGLHLRRVRQQALDRSHSRGECVYVGIRRRRPAGQWGHARHVPAEAGQRSERPSVPNDRRGRVTLNGDHRREGAVLHVGGGRLWQARPRRHDAAAVAPTPRILPQCAADLVRGRHVPLGRMRAAGCERPHTLHVGGGHLRQARTARSDELTHSASCQECGRGRLYVRAGRVRHLPHDRAHEERRPLHIWVQWQRPARAGSPKRPEQVTHRTRPHQESREGDERPR